MSWISRGARISPRDIEDLNIASEDLAAVAELIKRNRPSYGDAAIQLLIRANSTVVRIQNKGAAAFARYLEKHGLREAPGDTETTVVDEGAEASRSKTQDEEE